MTARVSGRPATVFCTACRKVIEFDPPDVVCVARYAGPAWVGGHPEAVAVAIDIVNCPCGREIEIRT